MRAEKTSCLSGHKRAEERVRHQWGWVMSVMCRVYCDHCEPLLYMRSPAVSIPSLSSSGPGPGQVGVRSRQGMSKLPDGPRKIHFSTLVTRVQNSKVLPSKFDTNASQACHRWHHWLHCHHNRSMIVKPFWWAGCRQYVGHTSCSSI